MSPSPAHAGVQASAGCWTPAVAGEGWFRVRMGNDMTIDRAMLQPAVALVVWTLAMLVWVLATRLPAMKKAGVDLRTLVGTKGADADRVLPAKTQWIAHNYNHLLEQPVLFYVAVLVLALTGPNDLWVRAAAWAYVTLRIVHSVWQATVNHVGGRFVLFLLSTLTLMALAGRAAWVVFPPMFAA